MPQKFTRSITICFTLLFLLVSSASIIYAGAAEDVLAIVNAERANDGKAPLTLNAQLNAAALVHANDMINNNFFSHTGSDGSSPSQRITAAGYSWSASGENIAAGYTSAAAVMNGWMNSPGHRANILNGNFTEMGLARVGNHWVQTFGRPSGNNNGGGDNGGGDNGGGDNGGGDNGGGDNGGGDNGGGDNGGGDNGGGDNGGGDNGGGDNGGGDNGGGDNGGGDNGGGDNGGGDNGGGDNGGGDNGGGNNGGGNNGGGNNGGGNNGGGNNAAPALPVVIPTDDRLNDNDIAHSPLAVYCAGDTGADGVSIWTIQPGGAGIPAFAASGAQISAALTTAVQTGQSQQIAANGTTSLWALASNELQAQAPEINDLIKIYRYIFSPTACGALPAATDTTTQNTVQAPVNNNPTTLNAPTNTTPSQVAGQQTYTVQSGDNLFRIALRFNTSIAAIAQLNGITDPTRIFAGQVLLIPA